MEKYIIYRFEHKGIFLCTENTQENGDVFLIGSFENQKKEQSFIKQIKDKKLEK